MVREWRIGNVIVFFESTVKISSGTTQNVNSMDVDVETGTQRDTENTLDSKTLLFTLFD